MEPSVDTEFLLSLADDGRGWGFGVDVPAGEHPRFGLAVVDLKNAAPDRVQHREVHGQMPRWKGAVLAEQRCAAVDPGQHGTLLASFGVVRPG
jgi:hypothetical protein